jgi:hypothetical protein
MQLGLVEDHPTVGTVTVKRAELETEHAPSVQVRQRRPRRRVQIAVEHLGHEVLGNVA